MPLCLSVSSYRHSAHRLTDVLLIHNDNVYCFWMKADTSTTQRADISTRGGDYSNVIVE